MFNHIRELHHSQTCFFQDRLCFGFNHIRELHHSQTAYRTSTALLSLTIFVNYITLKRWTNNYNCCFSLTIFVNYITLKPQFASSRKSRFSTSGYTPPDVVIPC